MSCCDLHLTVREEEPITLEIVEATIKPEQDKTVTPTYSEQTVLPDAGMTLGSVTVEPIPEPTDRMTITENGSYDVARIGGVDVEVPQGVFPEGTLEISENGVYDVSAYEYAHTSVSPPAPTPQLLWEYTADGTATSVTIPIESMDLTGVRTLWLDMDLVLSKGDWVYLAAGSRTCWGSQRQHQELNYTVFVKRGGDWYTVVKSSVFAAIDSDVPYLGDLRVYTYGNALMNSGTIKLYGE